MHPLLRKGVHSKCFLVHLQHQQRPFEVHFISLRHEVLEHAASLPQKSLMHTLSVSLEHGIGEKTLVCAGLKTNRCKLKKIREKAIWGRKVYRFAVRPNTLSEVSQNCLELE